MHLDVDAAGEQRLHELQRERAVAQVHRLAAVRHDHGVVVDLELHVVLGAGPVGEPDERDRVGGGDLDPVAIEAGGVGVVDQLLDLHEEVADPRRQRHGALFALTC